MTQPHGDDDAALHDDAAEADHGHVETALSRFGESLSHMEGHKRRLIDAFGWWVVRGLLVAGFLGLIALGRPVAASLCAFFFLLTLFCR